MQIWKLLKHFGHGNLPESELAGLLSECGYKGDQLTAILHKAAETCEKPHAMTKHKSIIVRAAARTLERNPSLRRVVPESTKGICFTSCAAFICCGGFFASMSAWTCVMLASKPFRSPASPSDPITSTSLPDSPTLAVVGIIGTIWSSTTWQGVLPPWGQLCRDIRQACFNHLHHV